MNYLYIQFFHMQIMYAKNHLMLHQYHKQHVAENIDLVKRLMR